MHRAVAVGSLCLTAAVLSGCADSLPVSALPTREQMARPVLDKAEQQKAMDALVKERDERQAKMVQTLETQPVRR